MNQLSTQHNIETEQLEFLAPRASKAGRRTYAKLCDPFSLCSLCLTFLLLFRLGEQVFMNYGARCNAEFVLHQGFFYPEHEHDFMSVPLSALCALFPSLFCRPVMI